MSFLGYYLPPWPDHMPREGQVMPVLFTAMSSAPAHDEPGHNRDLLMVIEGTFHWVSTIQKHKWHRPCSSPYGDGHVPSVLLALASCYNNVLLVFTFLRTFRSSMWDPCDLSYDTYQSTSWSCWKASLVSHSLQDMAHAPTILLSWHLWCHPSSWYHASPLPLAVSSLRAESLLLFIFTFATPLTVPGTW